MHTYFVYLLSHAVKCKMIFFKYEEVFQCMEDSYLICALRKSLSCDKKFELASI